MTALLYSLQTGVPQHLGGAAPWTTAFFKEPVSGPILLSRLNLEGDRQADLTVHGGPDKAVCAYPREHYATWAQELGEVECGPGWFGENFTVAGLTEADVCVGDVFSVGPAVVQVSQPRAPCWKLGRRWHRIEMPKLVLDSGRTGWYFRVLEEGVIAAGQPLERIERPFPEWSIETANRIKHFGRGMVAERRALATCPALSESWRESLARSLERP